MRRPRVLPALVALVVAGCGGAGGSATTTGSPAATATPTTVETPPGDTATVTRIYDGDSFEVDVAGAATEVRLLGINAPEGHECHGAASRTRLVELLGAAEITLVQEGEDDTDRFGRLLRSVYVGGSFVNAIMVAEGHAVALQGGAPQEAYLVELADAAYDERRGMWAPDACDEPVDAAVSIVHVEYDPPGRDWENKTGEWVVVRNAGSETLSVGGWILRDESSTHRFELPEGSVLDPGAELRIRTGCGEDGPTDVFWCAEDAVWSNGGDTAILQTAAGTVVARARYDGDY